MAMLSEISMIISGVALLRMLFYPVPADKQKTFGILDDHAMKTSSALPSLFVISARNSGKGTGFTSKSKLWP